MSLNEEIQQAAKELGKHMGTAPSVQEFVSLNEETLQNAEVIELENKLAQLYQKLVERQQNGEVLNRSELDEYYDLKRQAQEHPLIAARDYQLEIVKALFIPIAQRITAELGFEYTTFAR